MSKKTQKLKPDTVLKNYWNDNEQFADLFNAALFEGRQVIRSDELEDIDTEESNILEHKDYAESIKASRDNIKIQKRSTTYGVHFVMFGLESQEHIHYAMPMRVMGYDYGVYKKQYDNNAKQYKTAFGMEKDEYLSRMKKADKFIPVITIVVYYGDKVWDGATSLCGMLNIPEEMKVFVNDYKMKLVEARENKLLFHNINNRDLFNLLQILLDTNIPRNVAKKMVIQYSEEHEVDRSVVMTVVGAANIEINYNELTKKGDLNMCTVFEETMEEGRIKGKIEGEAKGIVETGREFGISDNDILERLQEKLGVSLQVAEEYLEIFI